MRQGQRFFKTLCAFVGAQVLALSHTPSALADHHLTSWREVGEWSVFVDANVGHGCFMEKTFKDRTRVRLGKLPKENGAFFSASNKEWDHIEEGSSDEFYFDFGDELFKGQIEAKIEGDWYGGYAFFNNPEFLEFLATKTTLTIAGSRRIPLDIDLSGTKRAIDELGRCQAAQPE